MGALLYYIFYGITWLITLLPLRVLYIFSDFIFLLLYYFPSYRRKVVMENLVNSFPEKNSEELKVIEKKFYRHLADIFVETLKISHMSDREQRRRFTYSNLEIIDKLRKEKRDIIALLGHYNNWEWPTLLAEYMRYLTIIIYKPLQNQHFDRFMNRQRSKNGIVLTPMSHVIREIIRYRQKKINTLSVFISDQTPAKKDIKFRMPFLNQDTPVFTGAEKIAARYDMAVVFFNIQKIKRGYYNLDVELMYEHAAGLPEYALTEKFTRRLEEIIREKPEYWIWSHRRWKY
ncbi:MAG TPA: lysophospholipid acyltransferase family protein [Bacteroidales bacterium]|nr:lysophospholipid acyltransferase family protein [Bacteroidales bacterium]